MVRVFICIRIPERLINEIEEIQKRLKKSGVFGKYVEKDNFHVTLTFIGEVNEGDLHELKNKMEKVVEGVKSFDIELSGIKTLPNKNYIRVIGIKVISDELKNLIRKIGQEIGGSFYEDQKVTLCRVKKIDRSKFNKFLEKNVNVNLGVFNVKSICLVKSTLTRNGPIYETLYEVNLNEGKSVD